VLVHQDYTYIIPIIPCKENEGIYLVPYILFFAPWKKSTVKKTESWSENTYFIIINFPLKVPTGIQFYDGEERKCRVGTERLLPIYWRVPCPRVPKVEQGVRRTELKAATCFGTIASRRENNSGSGDFMLFTEILWCKNCMRQCIQWGENLKKKRGIFNYIVHRNEVRHETFKLATQYHSGTQPQIFINIVFFFQWRCHIQAPQYINAVF